MQEFSRLKPVKSHEDAHKQNDPNRFNNELSFSCGRSAKNNEAKLIFNLSKSDNSKLIFCCWFLQKKTCINYSVIVYWFIKVKT